MYNILLLQGPNLNLTGVREPSIYGSKPLVELESGLQAAAEQMGANLQILHSNAEHELIDAIQAAPAQQVNMILLNAGAYTHTSIAIRDALLAVQIPFIEIHMSNIFAREAFRQQSYLSDIAVGVVSGFGWQSYHLALQAAIERCQHGHS